MRLTPQNSTDPRQWGKELQWVLNNKLNIQVPNEIDFLKEFHGTFYLNAKDYFKSIYGTG